MLDPFCGYGEIPIMRDTPFPAPGLAARRRRGEVRS